MIQAGTGMNFQKDFTPGVIDYFCIPNLLFG